MVGRVALCLALAFPALAGEEKPIPSEDWITLENCQKLRDEVIEDIEEFTRIRFRRPVPIRIMSAHEYSARRGASGFEGWVGAHAAAYYSPDENEITVIPWRKQGPAPAAYWEGTTRRTMIHEMAHALHHQNFWTQGPHHWAASKVRGLSEEEIDAAVVDNLLNEGFAELVEYGIAMQRARKQRREGATRLPTRMARLFGRGPAPRPDKPLAYLERYVPDPDATEPFRIKLLSHVYRDGLTLMYHLMLQGGMRAVRSVLYRPPHRLLLFQPSVLASADLSDPPEPDAIFGFLHPGPLGNEGILLATRPGKHRYFDGATRGHAPGCLLGYVASARDGPFAGSRYAFFIADPGKPGVWADEQLEALEARATGKVRSRIRSLPLAGKVKARLTIVPQDGRTHIHGEIPGIVVLVKLEADRIGRSDVRRMEERVLHALNAILIKKPKAHVFRDAMKTARAEAGYGR